MEDWIFEDEEELVENLPIEPLEEEEEILVSEEKSLLSQFLDLFLTYSFTNTTYGTLVFHTILGQIFKDVKLYLGNREISLMVHIFLVSDSGSGKSSAIPIITQICNSLEIPIHIQRGEVSEAGLVGTFGIRRTVQGGRVVETVELIPGALYKLANGGIIVFDEAGFVLKSGEKEYTKHILNYLQTAMDNPPANQITKIMASGEIIFSPRVSFIFLTYPIPFKMMEVLKGGFFQRALPYFRKLTQIEWDNIKKEFLVRLAEKEKSFDIQQNIEFTQFINRMREIINWVRGNRLQVVFSQKAKELLDEFYKKFEEKYGSFEGDKKDIINTFKIRSMVEVCKLASHYALIEKRTIVQASDVEKAENLIFNCLDSMVNFMEWVSETKIEKESWEISWERIRREWWFILSKLNLDSEGRCPIKNFKDLIASFLGVSEPTAYRLIDIWSKKGLIKKLEGNLVKLR
ncbi:MAG: DUF3987 domain-containing protein [Candidatus Aenigmatarchaeota archaeon]